MQKILDHINHRQAHNNLGNTNALRDKLEYLSFKNWDIIIGEKAKLITGNYRIKALKEYLHHLKLLENE